MLTLSRSPLRTGLAGILLACLSACNEERTTQEERETMVRMAAREGRSAAAKHTGRAAPHASVSAATELSRSARQP